MPHTPDSTTTPFDNFVARLISSGVAATRAELVGCSDDKIEQLQRKYALSLPMSYRLFLRTMGHRNGRLFTHDHVTVSYRRRLSTKG